MKIGSKKTCIHGNFGSSPAEPAPSDSGGWSRSFAYDQYGNMWVTGAQGVGMSGNMPTMDSFTNKNQINYLSYDAAGNLLSATGDTVTYDAENRLTSAYDTVTHNTETYLYDGAGQRVEKSGPGGTAVYLYDAFGQLAAEYSTTQNTSPCTTCYLSYDYLGSVRLVTDQNGNVVARHDYLPFGEEVPTNTAGRNGQWGSSTDTEQKFTGQIRDNETGMDYFNARYFSNALGRFNSADPGNAGADLTDPQTWNGYGYVMNNPVALVDPSGAQWRTVDVEVCTPAVSSSVSFIPINPYGIPGGSSALCHYETRWVWYPDPGSDGGGGGGTGGGGGGGNRGSGTPSRNGTPVAIVPFPTQRSCSDIANDINDLRDELARRFQEYGESAQPLPLFGKFSRAGHVQQITNKQINLRNLLNEFNTNGCGGTPGVPGDAWHFASRQAPAITPSRPWVKYAATGAGVIIVGGTVILAPELLPLEFALVP